jgi:acetyl-CoA carboxylase biotin carboxyl carrier protein
MGGDADDLDIFDVERLTKLVELMNQHDLAELDLRQRSYRICIRKGGEPVVSGFVPRAVEPTPAAAVSAATPAVPPDAHLDTIVSPMVGTYYSAPDPESPPFVKVGDHVGPTTTVCVIEAMKVFNPIPAEKSGQVVAVLVENGEPVEFNQPLFKVDSRK